MTVLLKALVSPFITATADLLKSRARGDWGREALRSWSRYCCTDVVKMLFSVSTNDKGSPLP